MPSSYTNLLYHIVFSTKDRQPTILPTWRDELHRYIGGIVLRQHGVLHEINSLPDHVHLLVSLRAEPSVATTLRLVKANSSKWVNRRDFLRERFGWQPGYAAVSVSASKMEAVCRYIRNQESRHRRLSFDEELKALLRDRDLASDTRTRLIYHIVFGTKYRRPVILPTWREELYRQIGDIVSRQRGELYEINGMPEHLHLLAHFRAEPSVAAMLRLIKTNSSKWVTGAGVLQDRFDWQVGYAAFSVSLSEVETVRRYIRNQEKHHRRFSYDVELKALLRRHERALSPPPTQPRRGDIE